MQIVGPEKNGFKPFLYLKKKIIIYTIKNKDYLYSQTINYRFNNEIHLLDPSKDDFVYKSDYNKICFPRLFNRIQFLYI